MTTDEMLPLLDVVRAARAELHEDDAESAIRCAKLLRLAEEYAEDLPREVIDSADTLQAITAVRTELGTCLIASDRMMDAGVAADLVASVLRRGTMLAERALVSMLFGPEAVAASF
jgi:hypothetical protein